MDINFETLLRKNLFSPVMLSLRFAAFPFLGLFLQYYRHFLISFFHVSFFHFLKLKQTETYVLIHECLNRNTECPFPVNIFYACLTVKMKQATTLT